MKILDVSLEDGRKCAALINALKLAQFEKLTMEDMESLMAARRWLMELALDMAKELKGKKEGTAVSSPKTETTASTTGAPPSPAIRVKKMVPGASGKRGKK